ncbi:hypothetical protein RFI_26592 [Reticulomyxa filosa]|uniref:Uncharacterized protein n=1 Tax=Reticulomyxa filosa TaxID=46433 RepID=X6MA60_RETFI|nr:hypothetical protein RFI_26592 [Reticulomyxa filosa]|eukprot:ETO10784.1 hypothetical protein RFI_26592 [Reticulomyxa filosa]
MQSVSNIITKINIILFYSCFLLLFCDHFKKLTLIKSKMKAKRFTSMLILPSFWYSSGFPQQKDVLEYLTISYEAFDENLHERELRLSVFVKLKKRVFFLTELQLQKFLFETEEHYLKLFLKNNNNSCPIQSRDIKCDFKGKLKDLNNNLINKCNLNLIDCNHICINRNLNDHHISPMKLHFGIVAQLLQSMRQEIELKDNRLKEIFNKDKKKKEFQIDLKLSTIIYFKN